MVCPTPGAKVRLRPLAAGATRLDDDSFWERWQRRNRMVTIPLGARRLEEAGNLDNLRLAAGHAEGSYRGPQYLDSDVYKWLEAAAWEQGREPSDELAQRQQQLNDLVASAQRTDGYLNSYYQTHPEVARFSDLAMGHELFCAGHLMQAAIAQQRITGVGSLLAVATKFADYLVSVFGPGKREGVPGHPEVEMALVELYRTTGTEAYLDLARYFIEARGHRLLEITRYDHTYYQDRVPVRQARTLEGHAVRALYLAAGVADLATETGDRQLLDALVAQWNHVVSTKLYLTGGMGSRWEGEALGDPYELPPDRGYCETCAAVASVQWSWRMLLATGQARYADLIERTIYNAILPGLSLDGDRFFYVNPLQLRSTDDGIDARDPARGRAKWYTTACCPPNVMRFLSSVHQHFATVSTDGLQLHQYASGSIRSPWADTEIDLVVRTAYPWDEDVEIEVRRGPVRPWQLSLRLPAWCEGATVTQEGVTQPAQGVDGWVRLERRWSPGDTVSLHLPMPARHTRASGRVDALRGCAAIERGPLVYCTEQVDLDEVAVDDLRLDGASAVAAYDESLLGGVRPVHSEGSFGHDDGDLYGVNPASTDRTTVSFSSVPYYAWANRALGPMRVWIPLADGHA